VVFTRLTSSDGWPLPTFDAQATFEPTASPAIFFELIDAVRQEKIPLEQALPVVTSNVAAILKLRGKGRIANGMDADLLFLDEEDRIRHLLAGGRWLVHDGKIVHPSFFA
jgi:beta-aspartyl-dipeptidase (metallo-type)